MSALHCPISHPSMGRRARPASVGSGAAPHRIVCAARGRAGRGVHPAGAGVQSILVKRVWAMQVRDQPTAAFPRLLLAGAGVGAHGLDRGLLAPDGKLARRWDLWAVGALPAFGLATGVAVAAMTVHLGSRGWERAGDATFVLSCCCFQLCVSRGVCALGKDAAQSLGQPQRERLWDVLDSLCFRELAAIRGCGQGCLPSPRDRSCFWAQL